MMTNAYSELYLDDAMENLGSMIDYAVGECGLEPDEFMNRLTNVKQNIARYKSWINNKKRQKDLQNNKTHLEHWQNKLEIMTSILKDRLYERDRR